jgi:hypothetical protein
LVQNLLSFFHIHKDKSEIFENNIALVCCGSKLFPYTETRIQPKVLENRVVREYLEIKMRKKDKVGENLVIRNVKIWVCLQHNYNVHIKEDKMGWADFVHGRE